MATHPLEKLVYIDIGFGYQYLRMEFRLPGACYSFLMRDEDKCTICSSTLACEICPEGGVVRGWCGLMVVWSEGGVYV